MLITINRHLSQENLFFNSSVIDQHALNLFIGLCSLQKARFWSNDIEFNVPGISRKNKSDNERPNP